jgi:hypothetical protein
MFHENHLVGSKVEKRGMYRLEWSTHRHAFVLLGRKVCSELGLPSLLQG